jgi:hypothetical protein
MTRNITIRTPIVSSPMDTGENNCILFNLAVVS